MWFPIIIQQNKDLQTYRHPGRSCPCIHQGFAYEIYPTHEDNIIPLACRPSGALSLDGNLGLSLSPMIPPNVKALRTAASFILAATQRRQLGLKVQNRHDRHVRAGRLM